MPAILHVEISKLDYVRQSANTAPFPENQVLFSFYASLKIETKA